MDAAYPQLDEQALALAHPGLHPGVACGLFDGLAHEPRRHGVQPVRVVVTGRPGRPQATTPPAVTDRRVGSRSEVDIGAGRLNRSRDRFGARPRRSRELSTPILGISSRTGMGVAR
jgi:hypothetical protein